MFALAIWVFLPKLDAPASLDNIINAISDCKAVLVSKIGHCPQEELQKAGLQIVEAYDVIEKVALEFYEQWIRD